MMRRARQFGWLWMVVAAAWMIDSPVARAQDYVPVQISDIKNSPQRYWAKGIVFRDVLTEAPQKKRRSIDDRDVTRFYTEQIGELYAEDGVLETLRALPVDREYLFAGTVGQRGRNYYVVVQRVAGQVDPELNFQEQLRALNLANPTNVYNMAIQTLFGIMREVEADLTGYAAPQNLEVGQLFDVNSEHYGRISTSVRNVLRRVEDQSKMPSSEFLVNLIISMMAVQRGHGEAAQADYQPAPDAELIQPAVTLGDEPAALEPAALEPAAQAAPEKVEDVIEQLSGSGEDVTAPAAAESPAEP